VYLIFSILNIARVLFSIRLISMILCESCLELSCGTI
jgi:hypothetical protein